MNIEQLGNSKYNEKLEELSELAHSMRKSEAVDVSLNELLTAEFSETEPVTTEKLYADLGIDPQTDTISNVLTVPGNAPTWVVPEMIRESIRLGLRKAPIYPNITAVEQSVKTNQIVVPSINMSDAAPRWVNEGETITFGNISYGEKKFSVRKMGRGISITDEVQQFVALDVVGIFLQDFGIKLGYALDSLAIDVLLNGEQADGSTSAPVIGVKTVGTLAYRDLVRIWVRLSRLGRKAQTMISGEDMMIDLLDLPEFKLRSQGTTEAKLNVKTPIPNSSDLFVHGSIPAEQIIILDPGTTMMKFNTRPLLIETERVVSKQVESTYCSLSTGFAIMFQDSRMVLDRSVEFDGFPDYMNVDVLEVETIK